jgi:type IV pilus assembly protein PilE
MKLLNFSSRGFSLLEVMVALVIVGILAAVAFPAYQDSVTKTRRAEGQAALLDLQNRMERYFIDNNSYADANIGGGDADEILSSAATENGWYNLQISSTATTYTLSAVPQGAHATNDTKCGTLSITNLGVKSESGTATDAKDCW